MREAQGKLGVACKTEYHVHRSHPEQNLTVFTRGAQYVPYC